MLKNKYTIHMMDNIPRRKMSDPYISQSPYNAAKPVAAKEQQRQQFIHYIKQMINVDTLKRYYVTLSVLDENLRDTIATSIGELCDFNFASLGAARKINVCVIYEGSVKKSKIFLMTLVPRTRTLHNAMYLPITDLADSLAEGSSDNIIAIKGNDITDEAFEEWKEKVINCKTLYSKTPGKVEEIARFNDPAVMTFRKQWIAERNAVAE
jgi:hypothetical protein